MRDRVYQWVSACQDCGSLKARPQAVVPPLRSVRAGAVGDRWAMDVAGPLPITANGHRYVIAAIESATRYAVAVAVPNHTAIVVARFLMERVILVFGSMREIMIDGAAEFCSEMTTELLALIQAKQTTHVPYRPNLLGMVERFHRTWKDIVSLYVRDGHNDWDDFLPAALYAYNSSRHTSHGFQPNELMMGRKLRFPGEVLLKNRLEYPHNDINDYHRVLINYLQQAQELAKEALEKEQARQAIYYNQRKVRQRAPFKTGQLVWVYRSAKGPGITKFRHRWRGPAQVKMLESGTQLVTHCSFLLSYFYPTNLLEKMAYDIALDLREEAEATADLDP
ncbi:Enzymatic Polyprotein [Phytophthora palmivora]|uniref:Enzymatic Polyprotein n=1 Tax=Phytophthora palmivora TaxID=4796 RepID=A0A2P4WZC8_9STRA|nr:Enzymatic Polyprotein [Phytophthora palmivora]